MFTPLQPPVVGQKLNKGLGFIFSCTRSLVQRKPYMGAPRVGLEEALLDQSDQAGLLSLASSGGPLLSNL